MRCDWKVSGTCLWKSKGYTWFNFGWSPIQDHPLMYPWSVLSISISVFKHPVMSFHACALAIGARDRSFRNTDVYFQELDKGAQSNIWQLVQMMSDDCVCFSSAKWLSVTHHRYRKNVLWCSPVICRKWRSPNISQVIVVQLKVSAQRQKLWICI